MQLGLLHQRKIKVLRRMFGPKIGDVIVGWINYTDKELHKIFVKL
jgi:hypothetical protein